MGRTYSGGPAPANLRLTKGSISFDVPSRDHQATGIIVEWNHNKFTHYYETTGPDHLYYCEIKPKLLTCNHDRQIVDYVATYEWRIP